jgi:hypothetical protein
VDEWVSGGIVGLALKLKSRNSIAIHVPLGMEL